MIECNIFGRENCDLAKHFYSKPLCGIDLVLMYMYVGQTGQTPDQRGKEHRRASWCQESENCNYQICIQGEAHQSL